MLVTIIISVYNMEKYLKECVDSVLNQTYKAIEIILVDDGSKDNSKTMCDQYANKFDNISVIHKKNEGLGISRNRGLEYANGDFILFLDSDDYIDNDMIEKLVNMAKKYDLDVVKSGFRRVDDNHNKLSTTQYSSELFEKDGIIDKFLPRLIGSSPEKKDSIEMSVCATLYKTSIIKEKKLTFVSEREIISEDIIFNIDFCKLAKKAYLLDYVGYNYRFNPKSLTRSYKENRFERSKELYFEIAKRLKEMGYGHDVYDRLSRIFFVYLKTCLHQEKKKISNKKTKDILNTISNFTNDDLVANLVSKYPITKTGFKQKLFLTLVKNKMNVLILILINLNLI